MLHHQDSCLISRSRCGRSWVKEENSARFSFGSGKKKTSGIARDTVRALTLTGVFSHMTFLPRRRPNCPQKKSPRRVRQEQTRTTDIQPRFRVFHFRILQVSCFHIHCSRTLINCLVCRMHLMVRELTATSTKPIAQKRRWPEKRTRKSDQITVHSGQRRQAGVYPQEGPERRGHQVCTPSSILTRWQVLEVRFQSSFGPWERYKGMDLIEKSPVLMFYSAIDTVLPWRSVMVFSWRSSLVRSPLVDNLKFAGKLIYNTDKEAAQI